MVQKHYISADKLLQDAFRLGLEIHKSGFCPNYIVGVWRGGTPVGIAVQEIMKTCGVNADHTAIRTTSYTGIDTREKEVQVYGLEYLVDRVNAEDSLLIVDDIYDTGLSIQAILKQLKQQARRNTPTDIRIATPWFKPSNNQTTMAPHYYLYETDKWLVFPHELDGLTKKELIHHRPDIARLMNDYDILEQVDEP